MLQSLACTAYGNGGTYSSVAEIIHLNGQTFEFHALTQTLEPYCTA